MRTAAGVSEYLSLKIAGGGRATPRGKEQRMARLDVLLVGSVDDGPDGSGDLVQPTVSLVRAGDAVVVVDPGLLADPSVLVDALATHGVAVDDVTHVFVTHHHVDHTRNVGMFPSAEVVDGDSRYAGLLWADHDGDGYVLAPGVRVMATPGHSPECASLVVETDDGVAVLTHAWWFSDRTPVVDPLAADQAALESSRERILDVADLVVPGHGAPFRTGR
jgi:glyoxylase-like metal-dependent hydrolase (beta-lactamase superfamily II)